MVRAVVEGGWRGRCRRRDSIAPPQRAQRTQRIQRAAADCADEGRFAQIGFVGCALDDFVHERDACGSGDGAGAGGGAGGEGNVGVNL